MENHLLWTMLKIKLKIGRKDKHQLGIPILKDIITTIPALQTSAHWSPFKSTAFEYLLEWKNFNKANISSR